MSEVFEVPISYLLSGSPQLELELEAPNHGSKLSQFTDPLKNPDRGHLNFREDSTTFDTIKFIILLVNQRTA